jgi:hypothetical protein
MERSRTFVPRQAVDTLRNLNIEDLDDDQSELL